MLISPRLISVPVTPGQWYGCDLCEDDWRLTIPSAAIDELDAALEQSTMQDGEAPPRMPAVRTLLNRIHERMFQGTGVAVAGRLPVQEWGIERARRAITLLAHLMGPPTQQTHDGVTLYAVEDRGVSSAMSVRRSLTNFAQPFHSDGPWVRQPPWVVALFCLRAARTGGSSRVVSLRAMVEDLSQQAPELAARLARDMLWHRQSEHAPGDTPVSRRPIVWHDETGQWCGRLYADYVFRGYELAGEPIDRDAQRALEHLQRLANEEHRQLKFRLEAGDVVWLNNRWCLHSRTAFEAATTTARAPRQLVRVWYRLNGDSAALDG